MFNCSTRPHFTAAIEASHNSRQCQIQREGTIDWMHLKTMHQNALFFHKIFKNFPEKRHSPLLRPHPLPFRPYSKFMNPPLIEATSFRGYSIDRSAKA